MAAPALGYLLDEAVQLLVRRLRVVVAAPREEPSDERNECDAAGECDEPPPRAAAALLPLGRAPALSGRYLEDRVRIGSGCAAKRARRRRGADPPPRGYPRGLTRTETFPAASLARRSSSSAFFFETTRAPLTSTV